MMFSYKENATEEVKFHYCISYVIPKMCWIKYTDSASVTR